MKLIDNWHIDALAEHLQAIAQGDIRFLMINIGPGYAKSIIASVMFSAWMWAREPMTKIIAATYLSSLTIRDSIRARDLIASSWFRETFEPKWEWVKTNEDLFSNDLKGERRALMVGGGATGFRADGQIFDDLLNAKDRHSEAARASALDWAIRTMSSRYNDMRKGWRVVIGQRLHEEDPYGAMLATGDYVHLNLPSEFERERKCCAWCKENGPTTKIGFTDPRKEEGELLFPELFTPAVIAQAKKDLGQYDFCTPGYSPILMSDWSEKAIVDVQIGDEVVGYEFPGYPIKGRLVRSTVTNKTSFSKMVYRVTMANGREAHCTEDHRWYRRQRKPGCSQYLPARVGATLHSVYTPYAKPTTQDQRLFDWLGGILDGEGACHKRGSVVISQSSKNPEVQAEIKRVLTALNFDYGFNEERARKRGIKNPKWSDRGHYWVNGGRSGKMRILNNCHMVKGDRIRQSLWESAGRLTESLKRGGSQEGQHRIVSIKPIGEMTVYGLTTSTHNYVAWGYASENSGQHQQRPAPAEGGMFKRSYWRRYTREQLPAIDITVISVDASFKKTDESDYVAIHVWGFTGPRAYLLARRHDRMGFTATKQAVRVLWDEFRPAATLIEDKANGTAVIEELSREVPGVIAINPEGGKEARAWAAQPTVEAGGVYLPADDAGAEEVIEEAAAFPNGKHDDDVDAMTQVLNWHRTNNDYLAWARLGSG